MNEFLYELLIMLVSVVGAGIVLLVGTLFTALIVKIIDKDYLPKGETAND